MWPNCIAQYVVALQCIALQWAIIQSTRREQSELSDAGRGSRSRNRARGDISWPPSPPHPPQYSPPPPLTSPRPPPQPPLPPLPHPPASSSPCPGCFWGSCAVRRTEWPGQWMSGLKYVSIIIMMLGFSKIFSFLLCFPEPKGFSIFWSYIHLIWSGVLSKTIVTFLKIINSKEGKKTATHMAGAKWYHGWMGGWYCV